MTYRALLIGNAAFVEDPGNLPTLAIGDDLTELSLSLTDPAVGMFEVGDVTALADRTVHELRLAIDEFFTTADRKDVLLIYYTGHGWRDINNSLYLCAADTRTSRLRATALSSTEINLAIESSAAATTIIVLDCCFSGAFKGGDPTPLAGRGRYLLSSSRSGQLSSAGRPGAEVSPFTASLVAGLRSAPAVGHLTMSGLYQYTHQQLALNSQQVPQRRFDGEGDIAVARRPGRLPPGQDLAAAAPRPTVTGPLLVRTARIAATLTDPEAAAHASAALKSGHALPGLAQAALSLAERLWLIEEFSAARQAFEGVLPVVRELVSNDPDRHQPELVAALSGLAGALVAAERAAEAVDLAEEAVGVARLLHRAGRENSVYLLGRSLRRYAGALAGVDRAPEAHRAAAEGVELLRGAPGHDVEFAFAVYRLALTLRQMNRTDEAIAAFTEAVELWTPLAAAEPRLFDVMIAESHRALAEILSTVEPYDAAQDHWDNAVRVGRRLAALDPDRGSPVLAAVLAGLSEYSFRLGRADAGLAAGSEAFELYESLAGTDPQEYAWFFAEKAGALATALLDVGRQDDALLPATKSVNAYRVLAAGDPMFRHHLANATSLFAQTVERPGSLGSAAEVWSDAADAYRELTNENPAFRGQLAWALEKTADCRKRSGDYAASELPRRQALTVLRELAAENPDLDETLGLVLSNLHLTQTMGGSPAQTRLPVAEELVAVRRQLAERDPEARPHLGLALDTLAKVLEEDGRFTEALACRQEQAEIFRQLLVADIFKPPVSPDRWNEPLAGALNGLADVLTRLGDTNRAAQARSEAQRLATPE